MRLLWQRSKLGDAVLKRQLASYLHYSHLALVSMGLMPDRAGGLSSYLATNGSFKWLEIRDTPIGDDGAIRLAEGRRHSLTLTSLSLCRCSISSTLHALTSLLASRSLKSISLEGNHIERSSEDLCLGLVASFKQNRTLTFLSLADCGLTTTSFAVLAHGLAQSSSLETIKLDTVDFRWQDNDGQSIRAISQALRANQSLKRCILPPLSHSWKYNNMLLVKLLQILKENKKLTDLGTFATPVELDDAADVKLIEGVQAALGANALQAVADAALRMIADRGD